MRKFLLSSLALISLASATTLEVLQVFQPISLHGTDVDYEFEGEHIQARVFSRPMVLSGAMPENLVAAIASPHCIPASSNYEVKESNLLALYKVDLHALLSEEKVLVVTFDLSKMKGAAGVELPSRTVLRLSIAALKQTLSDYHHAQNAPLKVRIAIAGTNEKNVSLKDLSGSFMIKN
jgi:hypothetical protein